LHYDDEFIPPEYPQTNFVEWKENFVKTIEADLNKLEDEEEYSFKFYNYSQNKPIY
jgi:hypothetical protein